LINLVDTGQCFRAPEPSWFDTETDWEQVRAELLQFPELRDPIKCAPGMQILRQPFVECVISFIVSANNNIKRFTKTLAQMQFNLEWLSAQTEDDFRKIGCGYRAPYLIESIKQLQEMNFDHLNALPDELLYKELRKVRGIGDKVAKCVMLFSFHRLNVVPVDTWIKKAQQRGIDFSKYGRYAGVAQQYVFYYMQYLKKTAGFIA